MTSLVEAVLALVARVSPNQIEAVAERFRGSPRTGEAWGAKSLLATPSARSELEALLDAWAASGTSGDFLAGLLIGATHARQQARAESTVELAWTGPTTPFVATRRTDQVLIDLIRRAERELFLVSFVAYDVPFIIDEMNAAIARGVELRILLEASASHGGSLSVDPVAMMKSRVPAVLAYVWTDRADPFTEGRVHAKVAVADGHTAFITSANLTGHALGKNMEAGVVIHGGRIPHDLRSHLHALIDTRVIRTA